MAANKHHRLVSFRVDSARWKKFLQACSKKDLSGSEVLRYYVDLVATEKISLLDKKAWG